MNLIFFACSAVPGIFIVIKWRAVARAEDVKQKHLRPGMYVPCAYQTYMSTFYCFDGGDDVDDGVGDIDRLINCWCKGIWLWSLSAVQQKNYDPMQHEWYTHNIYSEVEVCR